MLILLQKYADISKIKRVLLLKGVFIDTTYVFVFTYQMWSLENNSKEF